MGTLPAAWSLLSTSMSMHEGVEVAAAKLTLIAFVQQGRHSHANARTCRLHICSSAALALAVQHRFLGSRLKGGELSPGPVRPGLNLSSVDSQQRYNQRAGMASPPVARATHRS